MSIKVLGVAVAALSMNILTAGAAPVPPAAAALQSGLDQYCMGGTCWPIAFSYEVYTDPGMGTLIFSGYDTCNGGPHVTSPWLPSGYVVKTQIYVCAGMGPYLPPEW